MKRKVFTAVLLIGIMISTIISYAESGEWICPECGEAATSRFCTNCGTSRPRDEWICTNCGELSVGSFCGNCGSKKETNQELSDSETDDTGTKTVNVSQQKTGTLEGSGYNSPEDAVMAYLDGMNSGDVSKMLSTFAMESFVEHYDPESYIRRARSFNLISVNMIPNRSDYAKSIVLNARYGELARTLQSQYVEISAQTNGTILELNEEGKIQDLLEQFAASPANEWIGNVEFVEWIDPGGLTDVFYNAVNLRSIASIMACAGADDYAELVAHIRLNGADALQIMECIRYGDRWYNLSLQGFLSTVMGLPQYSAGLLYPIDKVEWNLSVNDLYDYKADAELASCLDSWEKSDLTGTCWKLDSVNAPGFSADIASGVEEALNDPGISMYADLKFMSLGGAVLDCRLSPLLVETTDAESGYMTTVSVWSDMDGELRFEESRGIGEASVDLSGVQCVRMDNKLILTFENGEELTFQRVRE